MRRSRGCIPFFLSFFLFLLVGPENCYFISYLEIRQTSIIIPLLSLSLSLSVVMDGHDITDDDDDDAPCISSNHSTTLDLPPSCVEFSPLHDCFVVGTYYLEPDDGSGSTQRNDDDQSKRPPAQDRSGSLVLFSLSNDNL